MEKLSAETLAGFLAREHEGFVDGGEMMDFVERYLLTDDQRAGFAKRGISVMGSWTGKYKCTETNERFIMKTFKQWNTILGKRVFNEADDEDV